MIKSPVLNINKEAANLPLTLGEVKNFLKVDFEDDDALIKNIIYTAGRQCQNFTGKTLIKQQYKYSFYSEVRDSLHLPYGPIQSLDSIGFMTSNGSEEELDPQRYMFDGVGEILKFIQKPQSFYRLDVFYTAGYGDDGEAVPGDLRQAVMMHIARMYEDRSGFSVVPRACMEIYTKYKHIKL